MGATQLFKARKNGCVYQFTNFCFDNSILEIFLALFNGMRLFIDEKIEAKRQFFSIERFCSHLKTYQITHAFLFSGLVESFEEDQFQALKYLDVWIAGAEKLSKRLMEKALVMGIQLIQNYGPTECCCYVLSRRMCFDDNPQNLGKALINLQITVRTIDGEVAIPFTAHKLYISGVGLMRGYLGRSNQQQPFVYFDGTMLVFIYLC